MISRIIDSLEIVTLNLGDTVVKTSYYLLLTSEQNVLLGVKVEHGMFQLWENFQT